MRFAALASLGLASVASGACAHREPPSPEGSPSVALPDIPAPTLSAASTSSPPVTSALAPAAATPGPSAAAAPPSPLPATPASASAEAAALPQTHDMPVASGALFEARVRALWDAIAHDDPPRALPFFFPLGAYEQVKDVGDPAADWKHRLVAAYARDIHALHARLGADATRAKLVSLDVPESRARWVDPGEEYNKIGYYRVFGSRLRYEVDGAAKTFDVKSLISWRGEWYVVHLTAIK